MFFASSTRGRILRSFGADTLGQSLNIITRLMLVPLFLTAWGANAYGEWLILTSIVALFSLGDLGSQLYFVNKMTEYYARGDKKKLQTTYSTGFFLLTTTSLSIFFLIYIVVEWTPLVAWLNLSSVENNEAKYILLLMAFKFVLSIPFGIMLGAYRAVGMQATSVMYNNSIMLLYLLLSVVALLNSKGMLFLAVIEVIPFAIVAIIVSIKLPNIMKKKLILFSLKEVNISVLKRSLKPSMHFFSIQISSMIIIQGTVLVVARTLGPVEVALFTSMRIVANVMSRFMSTLSHAAWPEVTRLSVLGSNKVLSRLFSRILYFTTIIGVVYLLFIKYFGESLYDLWLDNKLEYEHTAMLLMSIQVVFTIIWTFGGNILMATNKHIKFSKYQLLVNIFAIFCCYFLSLVYGLNGAVFGLILGQTIPMLIVVSFLLKSESYNNLSRTISLTTLTTLAIVVIFYFLS